MGSNIVYSFFSSFFHGAQLFWESSLLLGRSIVHLHSGIPTIENSMNFPQKKKKKQKKKTLKTELP